MPGPDGPRIILPNGAAAQVDPRLRDPEGAVFGRIVEKTVTGIKCPACRERIQNRLGQASNMVMATRMAHVPDCASGLMLSIILAILEIRDGAHICALGDPPVEETPNAEEG